MTSTRKLTLVCIVLFFVPGCAPVQRYRPRPLSPAETASRLEARSVDDPGLRRFVGQNLGHELTRLRTCFPTVEIPDRVLDGYWHPPSSPQECIFAQTTTCISADLTTPIAPCQFGGRPVCGECGCIASAALASIAKYELAGLVPISAIFSFSKKISERATQVGRRDRS